jgi:hypothetical protein
MHFEEAAQRAAESHDRFVASRHGFLGSPAPRSSGGERWHGCGTRHLNTKRQRCISSRRLRFWLLGRVQSHRWNAAPFRKERKYNDERLIPKKNIRKILAKVFPNS